MYQKQLKVHHCYRVLPICGIFTVWSERVGISDEIKGYQIANLQEGDWFLLLDKQFKNNWFYCEILSNKGHGFMTINQQEHEHFQEIV